MKTVGIIPARYHSSRFPGKVLADINGKSVLERVYEKAKAAEFDEVIVATDHETIKAHVHQFDGQAVMTSNEHQSGTERCQEALNKLPDAYELVVNIQADEPFINPEEVKKLKEAFSDRAVHIATLIQKIREPDDLFSPDVVKVVKDQQNFGILFSRTTIPYLKNVKLAQWISQYNFYSHTGIYAYCSGTLEKLVHLPESPLEKAESLEQLRWLDNGYPIKVVESEGTGISVDTPKDLEKAIAYASAKENT